MNKILKSLNVLLLSACTGAAAYGKAVDENTAKIVGANKLMSVGASGVSNPSDLTTAYVATAQAGFGVIVDYYVFNIQGGIGFVMVSGDDNIIPILAYSTESSFDINKISPAAKDWVEGYQNQITVAVTNNVPAEAGTAEKWNTLMNTPAGKKAAKTTGVSALVSTKWDQMPGYNNLSPVPGGGSSSTPTGCVATSIAQVMRYWNWPTIGVGSHTYTAPSYPTAPRTSNFGTTAYNWVGMITSSSTASTALLMSDVGTAVNMNFTPGLSGAYTLIAESPIANCSEFALKNYFHYKRSIHGVQRYTPGAGGASTTSTTAWSAILKTELDAGRPILYSGQGTSGGHAWVCDGWNADGTFHFNWGWGGTGPDGAYTVNALAPPALGTGGGGGNFNSWQGVIVGIEPDSFAKATSTMKLAAYLNCTTNSPATYPVSDFVINTKILNSTGKAFTGDFCLQVFDTELNYKFTSSTVTGKSIAIDGNLDLTFTGTGMIQMIPGSYRYRVLFKASGTTTWTPVGNNGTFINENGITVLNTQDVALGSNITITTPTTVKLGGALTLTAKVANNSPTTGFNGTIRAALTNVASGTTTPVDPKAGELISFASSNDYTFNYSIPTTLPTGMYTLAIQHKADASSAFTYTGSTYYQNPIMLFIGKGGVGVEEISAISDKVSIFPNPANDVININLNGAVVSRITITDIQGRQLQEVDATQVAVAVPVSNYASGIYFVNLYAGTEVVTKKIVVAK